MTPVTTHSAKPAQACRNTRSPLSTRKPIKVGTQVVEDSPVTDENRTKIRPSSNGCSATSHQPTTAPLPAETKPAVADEEGEIGRDWGWPGNKAPSNSSDASE